MRVGSRIASSLVSGAIVVAGLFAAEPVFGLEETGSIQGIVVAEDGGTPLPAALVVLDGTEVSATTGADGAFALDGVPTGTTS